MHILGAVLLIVASRTTTFQFFYPALLLYTLTYAPTMALTNSLSFHQMDNPGKQFPGIRVLGTIGWIVANNVIGWLGYTLTVEQLYVGAAASLMLGLYSFTLPHVPPKKEKKASFKELIGLDALSLFKNRAFATIMIASVLIFIPVSFYFGFTASFMSDIGIDPDIIPNRISMGQMAEILFILILPFFITRFGVKRVLFIGITAWMIRFLLFANGNAEGGVWMIYTAIILHGICYDFFVVTGQIFVDEKAPDHLKSSAQGLITFATYGLGMLIGTWFAGTTIDRLTIGGVADWDKIWYVPTVIAAVVLVIFIFLFKERKKAAQ